MADKQKVLHELLGISDEIDLNKEKLIIYLEEGDTQETFTVRLFDISKGDAPTLIKEIGYGMLSYLHDEDVLEGLKEAGKYSFNVQQQNIIYSDNVVEFKKVH
jgi:hypothetical protein|tara:strand:- start:318 stop:626 length:309 start_codon:yes stop_codon:yes gene_type:complete